MFLSKYRCAVFNFSSNPILRQRLSKTIKKNAKSYSLLQLRRFVQRGRLDQGGATSENVKRATFIERVALHPIYGKVGWFYICN